MKSQPAAPDRRAVEAVIRPRHKKTIEFASHGARLRFHVADDLFSSFDVDVGTRLLLRTLAESEQARRSSRVLDLGCGYGPIGLVLEAWRPEREAHLVDRDAVAVEFSRWNASSNGLADVLVYPSLGYDDVAEGPFDLVVSNIPAKAGTPAITALLLDARHFLAPDGLAAVVVIDRIADLTASVLGSAPVEVSEPRRARGYTCFHYRFTTPTPEPGFVPAFERGVYNRLEAKVRLRRETLHVVTAWGLPEFDTVSYATDLVAAQLERLRSPSISSLLAYEPGQGHLPLFAWRRLRPGRIALRGRDLLALRVSNANLARNGCDSEVGIELAPYPLADDAPPHDLALTTLPPRSTPALDASTVEGLLVAVAPGGSVVVGGSSTAITRTLERVDAAVVDRSRSRGFSAAVLRRGAS